jgi:ribosomal protein L1
LQIKKSKQPFTIVLVFPNGLTRSVKVKAVDRETAERRALKFQPSAIGIKRDA